MTFLKKYLLNIKYIISVSLSDFKDLLEEYFTVKNAPETEQSNKKDKLDDI